jgi:hypothetical protein
LVVTTPSSLCASSAALEYAPRVAGDRPTDGGARLSVASVELVEQTQNTKAREAFSRGNLKERGHSPRPGYFADRSKRLIIDRRGNALHA